MGPFQSKEFDTRTTRRKQKRTKKNDPFLQLLLLGTGDSGKTTILRQLKHSKGVKFTDKERRIDGSGLIVNIVEGMLQVIDCCKDNNDDLSEYKDAIEILKKTKDLKAGQFELVIELDHDIVNSVLMMWESELVKNRYDEAIKNGRYQVADTFTKLVGKLNEYPSWGGQDWIPTHEDCMLLRKPTSGIKTEKFVVDDNYIALSDVGGQRSERKKWYNLFQDVTGVIFVSSMSEYDQTLFEAHEVNRTRESLRVFKSTAENPSFKSSAFIMFFNKYDLFYEKYKERNIPIDTSGFFPDAPLAEDDDDNCTVAKKWFRDKFLVENLTGFAKERPYFHHFTSALDQGQLDSVITACATHIITKGLASVGLRMGANI